MFVLKAGVNVMMTAVRLYAMTVALSTSSSVAFNLFPCKLPVRVLQMCTLLTTLFCLTKMLYSVHFSLDLFPVYISLLV